MGQGGYGVADRVFTYPNTGKVYLARIANSFQYFSKVVDSSFAPSGILSTSSSIRGTRGARRAVFSFGITEVEVKRVEVLCRMIGVAEDACAGPKGLIYWVGKLLLRGLTG